MRGASVRIPVVDRGGTEGGRETTGGMKDAVDFYCSDMNAACARDEMSGAWIVDGVEHSLPFPGGRGEPAATKGVGEGDAGQESEPVVAASEKEGGKLDPHLSALDGKSRKEDKGYSDPQNAYFECNICLELAQDPVVTQCGHLYCWPCIYKCVIRHNTPATCGFFFFFSPYTQRTSSTGAHTDTRRYIYIFFFLLLLLWGVIMVTS